MKEFNKTSARNFAKNKQDEVTRILRQELDQ